MVGVDDRRREVRVDHAPALGVELDRPPAAGIGRDEVAGVGDHLDGGVDPGRGHGQRGVHRPRHLRIGAGEVDDEPVAALGDLHPDAEDRVLLLALLEDPVAVAEVLEGGGAIGQGGERRPHHPLRVVHDLLHDCKQGPDPVLPR